MQFGEGLVRGRTLCIRALVGKMPHSSIKVKDLSSGSSPRCLTSLHVRGQSVSGLASSHLRGIKGHSVGLFWSIFKGSFISVLSMSDIKKSYILLNEICSILEKERFNLRILWKKSPSKHGGIFGALMFSASTYLLYKTL